MRTGTHYLRALGLHLKHLLKNQKPFDAPVICSRENKFVYIPVPKAANTSIRYALSPVFGFARESVENPHTDQRFPIEPLSEILQSIDESWFFFTVVRDPYRRAFSAYNDKLNKRKAGEFRALRTMGVEKGDSFETFLKACNNWPQRYLNDHFIPQSTYLGPALKNPFLMTYQMENLPAQWHEICEKTVLQGLPSPENLTFENVKSEDKNKERKFSPGELAQLSKLYGYDYEQMSYEQPK